MVSGASQMTMTPKRERQERTGKTLGVDCRVGLLWWEIRPVRLAGWSEPRAASGRARSEQRRCAVARTLVGKSSGTLSGKNPERAAVIPPRLNFSLADTGR